ncbi:hypothetical protein Ctob_007992 [Chrysochromulina tobinii]|uniref:Uncharacterized protein n=1 Tax=Chrysochromulina tobinii TaxID=1460289 RepID=A0A0M0K0M5_9EUKA|nr:hypothetical protein Ctob_007992 [Chrysochromulina tobinii]|eukprot:KOO32431.1 hypothetical protein Ctob_007992 [Chrysochromulina sp. CCMP291]
MSSFKAGAGKRNLRQNSSTAAAAAVLEATSSTSTRTEFSAAVCQICNVIDELAQRERDEATDANDESSWRLEAIQIVTLMINSASRTMQMRATKTITALASQCGEQLKREVTEVPGMATKLVSLMKSGLLPGMSAAIDALDADEKEKARPMTVPISSKTDALVALRNIALSSDRNLEYISAQKTVIPQLVALMTKMHDGGDENRSATSGDSKNKPKSETSGQSGTSGSDDAPEKKAYMLSKAEIAARKESGRELRQLAESAGQMLHTLILQGKDEVKKIIIGAIISTVQQPGSKPPEDVPALMQILRSTAEEQLTLVQQGNDQQALQSALEFGRWIKVPTIMLGEARNNFKAALDKRRHVEAQRLRRLEMGIGNLEADLNDPKRLLAVTPRTPHMGGGATALTARSLGAEIGGAGGGAGGGSATARTKSASAAVIASSGGPDAAHASGAASGASKGVGVGASKGGKLGVRKLDLGAHDVKGKRGGAQASERGGGGVAVATSELVGGLIAYI